MNNQVLNIGFKSSFGLCDISHKQTTSPPLNTFYLTAKLKNDKSNLQ